MLDKALRLIALSALLLSLETAVWGADEKLSPELQSSALQSPGRGANVDVIVQYKVAPTDAHHRRVAELGGTLRSRLGAIKGAHYTVPRASLEALSADPDVAYVTPNRTIQASFEPVFDQITDQTVHSDWANSMGQTGAGIGIAVIDSGIADLPDFHNGSTSRIVYQQSFVGGSAVDGSAADQYGHGTHVAGILAGNGNGTVYVGVVPQANLINLRVLDQNGMGTDANVINAIMTAISLKDVYNIRVINLSLGRPVYEAAWKDPLCQAVEAAWAAGIAVVVAAGNEGRNNTANTNGYATIAAPGNDPYVITVGCVKSNGTSTMTDDRIASYSSKGPTLFDHYVKPDIVAPGNRIVSTLPAGLTLANQFPANRVTGNYFTLSGTSMATPVVAGAAAMAFQSASWMTPDQVKAAMMYSAYKSFPASSVAVDPVTGISYTSYYDIFTVGAGELNIQAGDQMTSAPPAVSAKSPSVSWNSSTGKVTMSGVSGSNVVWGTNVVWGSNVVWGTGAVLADNVVWGSNVVWGTSSLSGFNVVWGANVVWGTASTTQTESSVLTINGEQ
jgi:serine protease AprX